jgi:transcription elongation factor
MNTRILKYKDMNEKYTVMINHKTYKFIALDKHRHVFINEEGMLINNDLILWEEIDKLREESKNL